MDSSLANDWIAVSIVIALTATTAHNAGVPVTLTLYMLAVAAFILLFGMGVYYQTRPWDIHAEQTAFHAQLHSIMVGIFVILLLILIAWLMQAVIELSGED